MINIYGGFIKETGKCLYIGTTEREFLDRWLEHYRALDKGKHPNKPFQKAYNKLKEDGYNLEFREIKSIDSNSSLIKFFAEGLANSYYKPSCAKCTILQGRSRIVLSRCDKDLAKRLLEVF